MKSINRLSVRLFLSSLAVILIGFCVLVLAIQLSLPLTYGRHLGLMEQMMSGEAPMGMMGQGDGRLGSGRAVELYDGFRAGVNEALVYAVLISAAAAILLSLLIGSRLVAPIRAMTRASQRISDGHYAERVPVAGGDELALLARSFNRMAARLEQIEAMRRQLIGDVAHELRTPLTAIKGSMEGLEDGIIPAEPATFRQISQEAERLSRLVDDLQELSRVESGAYSLDRKPVRVVDLVGTAVSRIARQYEGKGVTLTADLPTELPAVMVDEDRIGQVLLNLLANALQHTPSGGQVVISACAGEKDVVVSVSDTGVGIAVEHLEHIFDRFYRVDKSRSRATGGGSGIGLTIARHLVEAHGGTITVASEGENRGSRFAVSLHRG
ncbi:MAG: HAMP domain-containing protein [Anaerolineales bacterium]|nr:HAMP domain-containing protein [Anaerolineales bacterium]